MRVLSDNTGLRSCRASGIGPFAEKGLNPYVSDGLEFEFHYLFTRKFWMMYACKALVACAGGFGTMDELFELLTLVQTGKKSRIPILMFGREFWTRAINVAFLAQQGVISPEDVLLFQYVETAEEAWDRIRAHYG